LTSTFTLFYTFCQREALLKSHFIVKHYNPDYTFCINLYSLCLVKGEGPSFLTMMKDVIIDVAKVKGILEVFCYAVLVAKNFQDAIRIFEAGYSNIDLVILDMVMPEMGGAEILNILKSINPSVKVILTSGYSLDARPPKIPKDRDGFIQKPYTVQTLSQKVREVLDKKI